MHTPNSLPDPEAWKPEWPSFSPVDLRQMDAFEAAVIAEAEATVAADLEKLQTVSRDYMLYVADNRTELHQSGNDLFDADVGFIVGLMEEDENVADEDIDELSVMDQIDQRIDADLKLHQLRLGIFGIYRASEILKLARDECSGSQSFAKLAWLDNLEKNSGELFAFALEHADTIINPAESKSNQSPGQQSS